MSIVTDACQVERSPHRMDVCKQGDDTTILLMDSVDAIMERTFDLLRQPSNARDSVECILKVAALVNRVKKLLPDKQEVQSVGSLC